MNRKYGQLAFLLLLTLIPAYVFYDIATRFTAEGVVGGSAENNAAMFPRLVAILLLGLIVLQAARTFLEKQDGTAQWLHPSRAALRPYLPAVAVFVLFLLYIAAFRWFGFVYSTPVFLVLVQLALGYRNALVIPIFALGVTGAVWVAFAKLLNLVLPAGDFFG